MSLRPLACILLMCVAAGPVYAQNLLKVKGGEFRSIGTFDMWGIELADWPAVLDPPEKLPRMLQPMAFHGVNTLAISLQGSHGTGRFFTPDGQSADPSAGQALTSLSFRARDHSAVLVVSLFSSRKEDWLASADAYRQAVQSAAKLIHKKHSSILVVGDLFGSGEWEAGCPYPMTDPQKFIELCRLIKQARPDAVVALPAAAVHGNAIRHSSTSADTPLFYAGQNADDLDQLAKAVRDNAEVNADLNIDGVTACLGSHLLCRTIAPKDFDDALRMFLLRVEKERLETKLPPASVRGSSNVELLSADEKADGWVPLFDGRSLEGWTTLTNNWGAWSIEDGSIKCAGESGAWLRSVRRYDDFILRLEFKITPGGNSGVFIRAPYDGRSSRFGMEVQIFGTSKPQLDQDTTGAIYAVLPPRLDAARPAGEWNDIEIACRGPHIRVTLNGTIVQDVHTREVPELKNRLTRGCFGLQDHGNLVWFRKIRIKELSTEGP